MGKETNTMSKSHLGEILQVVYQGALSNRIEPNEISGFIDGLADIFEKIPTQDRVKALNRISSDHPDMELLQQIVENGTRNKIGVMNVTLFMIPFMNAVNKLPQEVQANALDPKTLKTIASNCKIHE